MKNLTQALLLLAMLSGSALLSAQTVRPLEGSKYEIAIGDNTMTVDAGQGGKILSFKHGDQEVISQMRFPNAYGSTFWTSPQVEWNWPPVREYDSMSYTADVHNGTLILTGHASERFGYRIRKTFTPDPKDGAIVVSYTIINEGDAEKKVAPWEITRVPNGGFVLFDAHPKDVTPADLMQVSSSNGVARIDFEFELARRFQKRQTFDVAGRPADLRNGDVHVVPVERTDGAFDLVGDMRDDLDRAAEITAFAFPRDDAAVDFARGVIAGFGTGDPGDPFIVAEIQVGLRAVVGDENFAVLVRAHGAGVDVQVRIQFLHGDPVAAFFQQKRQRRRRDPFSQTRYHPAGYKNMFRLHRVLLSLSVCCSFFSKLFRGGSPCNRPAPGSP